MNSEIFVEAVKRYVRDAAIESAITNLKSPPGRKVSPNEKIISDWYNCLLENDRNRVEKIIATAVDEALFGLFCVLDGVRVLEDGESRGHFELNYVGDERVLLNNSENIGLHDLFNQL